MKRLRDIVTENVGKTVAVSTSVHLFLRPAQIVTAESDHFSILTRKGDVICVSYDNIAWIVSYAKRRVVGGVFQKKAKVGCAIILSQPTGNAEVY